MRGGQYSMSVGGFYFVAHVEGGRRLRVFENRVLSSIFGPKRDEIRGKWRKLHNEELNDLYSHHYFSGDQIKKNYVGGACSTYGEGSRYIQGFGGKT
jgi:hypothetical protein